MNPDAVLLSTFLVSAVFSGVMLFLLWFFWVAPRRIRGAVSHRLAPLAIRGAVRFSLGYWLVSLGLAVLVATVVAWLCWKYLGLWLYTASNDWHDQFATLLSQTRWVLQQPVENSDYTQILPLGFVLCTLLGIYAGALLAAWLGIKLAAKRFLVTRAMF